ncbi:MAG: Hint domain-containing protein [Proteobacteria bacterium]|nr:Hint domain-containing protein [Pseudomonadota bacterium]
MAMAPYPGRFPGFQIVIATALILAVMAIPAVGQDTAAAKVDDSHLADLSTAEFDGLLSRFKTQQKFSEDSADSFESFVKTRKQGLTKNPEDRSAAEKAAVDATGPGEMRTWVSASLKNKGWTNTVTAGTTDQYGNVELAKPKSKPAGKAEAAWAEEDRRITVRHEDGHVETHKADAKRLGLDMDKWQQWGPVSDKIEDLMSDVNLSSAQALLAITDLKTFLSSNFGRTGSDGSYLASKAKGELTAAQLELAKWALANQEEIRKFSGVLLDPVHVAEDEARQYRGEVEYAKKRAAEVKKTRTAKAGKSSGGASYGGIEDIGQDSCFAAGTKVALAGGGERRIEEVRIGDRVLGRDGAINTVTGIERPRLGGRLLYGFNGGPAFVTAEHPFWTAEGWKAIDPTATARENPRLRVGALAVGDRVAVAVISGLTPVSYAPGRAQDIGIEAIASVRADPDTVVYNLLLDGDHTYFADGYLVHNKGAAGGDGRI